MLNRSSAERLGCAAALCCAIAVLTLAAQPARAEDDDLSFEQKIINSLLGRNDSSIDYRERSPLVIPPSTDLPAPEKGVVAADPAWPNDPDVARHRSASASGRGPVIDEFERAARPLTPGELRRGAVRRGPRSSEPAHTPSDGEMGRAMTPAELGDSKSLLGGLFSSSSDKPVEFAGEPSRGSLIEPPSGYRTPAPSQPYGPPPDDKSSWYKPFTWYDWGMEPRK
jgi:hypothetical protein